MSNSFEFAPAGPLESGKKSALASINLTWCGYVEKMYAAAVATLLVWHFDHTK